VQSSAQYDEAYPLRPRLDAPWFGSGRNDSGAAPPAGNDRGTSLHAEQHYEYHRDLRSGDVLRATTEVGRTWEKEGRSGKLVFSETITRYVDETGEPIVTARSVSVRTEASPR
jgi:acyl-CoA thioesterase FadM